MSAAPDPVADRPAAARDEASFESAPSAAARARRLVRSVSQRAGLAPTDEDVATAELLVSELIANAVVHGRGEVRLAAEVRRGRGDTRHLRVDVADAEPTAPVVRHVEPDSVSGRGMSLVDALATRWGVEQLPEGGKSVWYELRLPA